MKNLFPKADLLESVNGVEAISKFLALEPDLILMDVQMPEMNGAEALEIIRKNTWGKNIPVIVLTNLGEEEAPKAIQSLGVHSYIVKASLTPREVAAKVKEALGIA